MRFSRALLVAAVGHLAVTGAVWATRVTRLAASAAAAHDVEIEMTPEPAPARTSETAGAVARREVERGVAGAPTLGHVKERGAGSSSNEAAPSGVIEPDHEAMGWAFRPTMGADLRLHGPVGATEIGEQKTVAARTSGGVIEALDAADHEKGLSRGGPALSAVEHAVGASTVMGNATFEVRVEASGAVTVDVIDASKDRDRWAALAASIRADVVARRAQLRIPPNARGLRIAIRVEAVDRLPDGRTKPKGATFSATPGSIEETKDHIDIEAPSATLAYEGKVCSAGVTMTLTGPQLAGGCSPENMNAVMVRGVAGRIVDESRF